MKIGILTSGGDAPGMNAVILYLTKYLSNHDIYFVINGYRGLIDNNIIKLADFDLDWNYLLHSGSIINSSRYPNFVNDVKIAINNINHIKLDYLIVIGGNGSYLGCRLLNQYQLKTIFIPASIDNDIDFSEYMIGFNSCVQEIVDDYWKIKSTFKTHNNICILEIMGRYASDLAIYTNLSVSPSLTITHVNKISINQLISKIIEKYHNEHYLICLLSEYVYSNDEINQLISTLENELKIEIKYSKLGYLQRGARPSSYDLMIGNKFAYLASKLINDNVPNGALYLKNNQVNYSTYDKLKKLNSYSNIDEEILNYEFK